MLLSEYIADTSRRATLAEEIGASASYLWQVATGWRGKRASPDLAKKIEVATAGAVTRASLRPDIWDESDSASPPFALGRRLIRPS